MRHGLMQRQQIADIVFTATRRMYPDFYIGFIRRKYLFKYIFGFGE